MNLTLENRMRAGSRVHFVGIGGIGMSALARFLLLKGYDVSGSDRLPGEQGEALMELGARVQPGHHADHIDGAELLVVSSAIGPDNPEVEAARARCIPVIKRSELLGEIVNAGRGVAIAGTHGKTTTSALIGHILTEAGLDPTILIGGIGVNLGSNARVGSSDLVVAEADEFDASFLQLRPHTAVITNVEADHLDYYGTLEAISAAFQKFALAVTDSLIVCADDASLPDLTRGATAHVMTYGIERGEWRASNIREVNGTTSFEAGCGTRRHRFFTRLAGRHNVQNALAAITVAQSLQIPLAIIVESLESFRGVARRFEIKGEVDGVLVMDDYAHHPTEIRANLRALRERFKRPIRLVFQPHTYSRTSAFFGEFAAAFRDADQTYLLDIYAARETNTYGVTSRELAEAAREVNADVAYTATPDVTLERLLDEVRPGDIVITMGAGDVYRLGAQLQESLARR
jgi:UDP-N-acetylmuramate--alanine ligase